MSERNGIFAGDNPFEIARRWLGEAEEGELNDPNAIALSTVDADGLPNVRMVLLKEIDKDSFVFYTNYNSRKSQEIKQAGKAAFVWHSKALHRQIRVRGVVEKEDGAQADAYYNSRSLKSRLGAIASQQSQSLASRATLVAEVAKGGWRIRPLEMEFWADGEFRLHDRFRWSRIGCNEDWDIQRLYP
ncbi:MAG: pyridoxamine 5'-phosphate oxidase [Rhodobacteraceae bacterium]|nr:pyridoxamine 5'-phosphate oxidase [Paracoccaceae bacterium]